MHAKISKIMHTNIWCCSAYETLKPAIVQGQVTKYRQIGQEGRGAERHAF
jgi:hypothetical protein